MSAKRWIEVNPAGNLVMVVCDPDIRTEPMSCIVKLDDIIRQYGCRSSIYADAVDLLSFYSSSISPAEFESIVLSRIRRMRGIRV